jgi:hypothetical protein
MPSADFWLLTRYVAIQGAAGFLMRRCLFRGSLEDSYPPTAIGYAGFLVIRVNPSRILLISILPHGKQISPDKDVNFPCTTAAFTLPPEPSGFVVLCQLAQELSLVCGFCPSARTFALRLPSDGRSPSRPCLRLALLIVSFNQHHRFSYRGLSPHKLTPMPGVHKRVEASVDSSASFRSECPPPHPFRYPIIETSIIELAKYIKTYII